jgi:hypothetical protein
LKIILVLDAALHAVWAIVTAVDPTPANLLGIGAEQPGVVAFDKNLFNGKAVQGGKVGETNVAIAVLIVAK